MQKTRLYVDLRQFHTIYKPLSKEWKISVYEKGATEPLDEITGEREQFVWPTKISEPGTYVIRIENSPFLKRMKETIEKEVILTEGKELEVLFERKDIKRTFPSFRADAPYRIEPDQEYIPLLVEIVDLPPQEKRIKIQSIHIYDWMSIKNPGARIKFYDYATARIENEDGKEIVDKNNKPYYFLEEEDKDGIYNRNGKNSWYRIAFLRRSDIKTEDKDFLHIGVRFVFACIDEQEYNFEMNLKIHLAKESLPKISETWRYGDIHYHSEFTNNLTEFGGPMRMAKAAGIASGLQWVAITDHSCDLDPKTFVDMQQQAQDVSEDGKFILIPSEEVTVEKNKERFKQIDYLHLLVHGADFIRGTFSGTHPLPGVFNSLKRHSLAFAFAAHPTAFKINWEDDNGDYDQGFRFPQFYGLQILNAKFREVCRIHSVDSIDPFEKNGEFRRDRTLLQKMIASSNYETQWKNGIKMWDKYLLKGLSLNPVRKLYIVAGSDAHGDFNYSIVVNPLTGNFITDNAFGKVRTLVSREELTEAGLSESLKSGRYIVTDGPVVDFGIYGMRKGKLLKGSIGEDIEFQLSCFSFKVEWKNTKEFGKLQDIKIIKNGKPLENPALALKENERLQGLRKNIPIEQRELIAYYRIEACSQKGEEKFFCYTNPIWVRIVG